MILIYSTVWYCLFHLHSFAYVEYSTVDEAKAVFDKQENIVLDERILFIDYAFSK